MAFVTKAVEIAEIARLVGMPNPGPGVGSSVYKALFNGVCKRLDIDAVGTMPQQAQAIVTAAKIPYNFLIADSRGTSSGGGSTVTLEGLRQIKKAVQVLSK